MNLFKYYMDVVALQTKLTTAYWESFVKGMERVNKDYKNEDFR